MYVNSGLGKNDQPNLKTYSAFYEKSYKQELTLVYLSYYIVHSIKKIQ